ncbi:MAG: cytochrome c biogenesis protein CcsA [Balneolaceae bacterium]|nr:cytochrome c biogenesis protein CcsA [Balneolaceae bacterium]MBO6547820.1 cytochrome c biogenesis protein CcsA [Balneolaceae bacterium]MBO6648331.1 cytochrome c biogenesis protein CcsA [Balneolaceae bacterium]
MTEFGPVTGIVGKLLITLSFLFCLLSLVYYFIAAKNDDDKKLRIGNWLFVLKGFFLVVASIMLVQLLMTHQFQYYYVFNYTSLDLAPKYLWSAFYGGQEGSFMLWILFSWIAGLGLMRWTRAPYKAPVLFFLGLTQLFLISMIVGWRFGDFTLGASPFRTIAEEMPNAPFIQANPDFVPADGTGLNDLLKSPWMMIHPPILFVGFAMMTIPYCFAMAALWKRKYNEWVGPALPWTLGSNLSLLTAIFLGGYWAYVTLSFGGFWAWDPVENASLVPWLIGTAGIHTMIIQRKSSVAQKSSLIFAILAYVAIVYETFLTRSGILADSSVHSFVDLGLYNQLLIFMLVITGLGFGMFAWRYKELPSPEKESNILSREFMTFTGAVMLFVLGLVIILGTSSPIIGLIFNENPTPPEISFYNDWSMPIAIIMALLTVLGQYLFWKKYDLETLATALIYPLLITSLLTVASVIIGDVRNAYYMLYLFAGFFAIVGNSWVVGRLAIQNPKLIGGSLTHVGFGLLLVGILASSAYNRPLLDKNTENYNAAVKRGEINDEQGFTVSQTVDMLELKLNQPKLINDQYWVTYEGYDLSNQNRPGQQTYKIRFDNLEGKFLYYLYPEVYPMLATSNAQNVNWSVDPDVRTGLMSDIYLYVAGSSFVEDRNNQIEKAQMVQPASGNPQEEGVQNISFQKGETKEVGNFRFSFVDFVQADSVNLPANTSIGIRARVEVFHIPSSQLNIIEPLFAIFMEDDQNYVMSPPVNLSSHELSFQFVKVNPEDSSIELEIVGLDEVYEEDWVLVVAEKKPFISVVWAGTFLLMGGFSLSIFRHWERERSKQDKANS